MKAEYVFILCMDGAGAFVEQAHTPNIDRALTAKTYKARTVFPTISAECWGSMLLGVEPEVHKLTSESISTKKREDWTAMSTIFSKFAQQLPGVPMYLFCEWTPIKDGILETWCGARRGSGTMPELTAQVLDTIRPDNMPKLVFAAYDSIDAAGHKFGYGSPEHLAEIEKFDAEFGKVYDKLCETDMMRKTVLIVSTDHGGTAQGSHGGDSDAEMNIFLGCGGCGIATGEIGKASILDIPVIAAHAVGLRGSNFWTGKIPEGVFAK